MQGAAGPKPSVCLRSPPANHHGDTGQGHGVPTGRRAGGYAGAAENCNDLYLLPLTEVSRLSGSTKHPQSLAPAQQKTRAVSEETREKQWAFLAHSPSMFSAVKSWTASHAKTLPAPRAASSHVPDQPCECEMAPTGRRAHGGTETPPGWSRDAASSAATGIRQKMIMGVQWIELQTLRGVRQQRGRGNPPAFSCPDKPAGRRGCAAGERGKTAAGESWSRRQGRLWGTCPETRHSVTAAHILHI